MYKNTLLKLLKRGGITLFVSVLAFLLVADQLQDAPGELVEYIENILPIKTSPPRFTFHYPIPEIQSVTIRSESTEPAVWQTQVRVKTAHSLFPQTHTIGGYVRNAYWFDFNGDSYPSLIIERGEGQLTKTTLFEYNEAEDALEVTHVLDHNETWRYDLCCVPIKFETQRGTVEHYILVEETRYRYDSVNRRLDGAKVSELITPIVTQTPLQKVRVVEPPIEIRDIPHDVLKDYRKFSQQFVYLHDGNLLHTNKKGEIQDVVYEDVPIINLKTSPILSEKAGFMYEIPEDVSGRDVALAILDMETGEVKQVYRGGFKTSTWEWDGPDRVIVYYGCGTACLYAYKIDVTSGKTIDEYHINIPTVATK